MSYVGVKICHFPVSAMFTYTSQVYTSAAPFVPKYTFEYIVGLCVPK